MTMTGKMNETTRYAWANEDPGTCVKCGEPFELVRPGKSQPTCDCWNTETDHVPDPHDS
jgi:hypothetical protein